MSVPGGAAWIRPACMTSPAIRTLELLVRQRRRQGQIQQIIYESTDRLRANRQPPQFKVNQEPSGGSPFRKSRIGHE